MFRRAARRTLTAPAVDASAIAARWREANHDFELNDYTGPASGPLWRIDRTSSSTVITAVHGVRHARPGKPVKANDANTGGLALVVAKAVGASSGVMVRSSPDTDANSVTPHPFKDELSRKLALGPGHRLLDLHGMADHDRYDIAIGLGPAPDASTFEWAGSLAEAFTRHGARVDLGGEALGLTARGAGTMTAWAQGLGVSAVQVEIAKGWRSFQGSSTQRTALVAALLEALS
jgi:hypothetical protein